MRARIPPRSRARSFRGYFFQSFFVDVLVIGALLTGANLLCASVASAASVPSAPSIRYALPAPAARYQLEPAAVDAAAELEADLSRPKSLPLRYAVERVVSGVRQRPHGAGAGGEWRDLADGMALWRIPLHVSGAVSLDFTFSRFFLPPGAQLFIKADSETLGPYGAADNPRSHRFATPIVHGSRAQIEVLLPQSMKRFLDLELESAFAGYRDLFAPKSLADPSNGSGTCNIDTICSAGDSWRDEISAVAALVSRGAYCSGQLVNNTAGDRDPLLLTAHHCFSSESSADSLVVYWKYENPTCRVIGSTDNGTPLSTANAIAQTGGASLLATQTNADVTLLRLHTPPPAAANPYYVGWDRTETAFSGGVIIHHPEADAKRISFASGAVVIDDTYYGADVAPGLNHWRVDHYDQGTTEPGSSGGALLDLTHHLRGVLSGGSADCSTPAGDDFYGRLSSAWQGDGTTATRLSDWLDPKHAGSATVLDGVGSCAAPTVTLGLSPALAKVGDRITISAAASGGTAPYSYAFDVDDDGIFDSTDPAQSSIPAVYPGSYQGNVSVKVTDSTGCSATASQALIVQSPAIAVAAAPVVAASNLCGSNDGSLYPGQRWRNQIVLVNNGDSASQPGYAIFAQDPATLGQTSLTLETPSVALPALAPGDSISIALDYAIDATTACASPVRIDLLGVADATGFQRSPAEVVSRTVDTACNVVTTCPAQVSRLRLDAGAYYDPVRPGTGMSLITLAQAGRDPLFFGLWFAGDVARLPTWYQVQAPVHGNQVDSPLFQTHQTQPPTWPQKPVSIGSAQITLVDQNKFVFSWNFPGDVGGALYVPVTAIASNIRIWNSAAESGWGIYDQLTQVAGPSAAPLIASLVYIYDGNGVPRWVQGNNSAYVSGAAEEVSLLRPACPGCIWLDYKAGQRSIGAMTYDGMSGSPTISTNISFPAPMPGAWLRAQLPLNALYLSQ